VADVNEQRMAERVESSSGGTICGVHGPPHWLAAKEPAVCIYVSGHNGPHSWEPEDD
jgi:hypothetical protein